ncbi:MAG: YtxH domain-containing protein [Anaerolineae bacterium]|nr:YtxH domain-containing protein [Anaerolineae bacterium]
MRVINFVAGFLVGAALAAIAVLLTAPQSGGELQAEIRARFEAMLAEGRKAAAARRAELEEKLTSLKAGQPTA